MVSYTRNDEDEFDEQPRYIDELNEDYVFTHDNFIKMVMINLRMNARVPLVIMGETGCGKTSLIKALASLKRAEMIIFNIHAGIDNNKILEFVIENKLLDDNENKFKIEYKKKKDIWVFLDEFNTSNSLGLFSEMMIKRSVLGKPIKKNVSFIAACNPYKKVDEGIDNITNIKKPGLEPSKFLDKNNIKSLAYSVNPLPFSLLNFVFSFDHLKGENEIKYVQNMLELSLSTQINFDPEINKLNAIEQNNKITKLKTIIAKSIIDAQNFVRQYKGISSVSLRDVNRFIHFFEWFLQKKREKFLVIKGSLFYNELIEHNNINKKVNIINTIKNLKEDKIAKNIEEIDDYIFSSILGIYVCYFLRLDSKKLRDEMNDLMIIDFDDSKIIDFEIFCKHIVKNLINEIEIEKLEKGIAKNRALLENLFALFICINNKIPLFLCGKPGCSKSLSRAIIEKAMRGKKSSSEKFKKLPEIVRSTYQGSITSTSEGVLNVFNYTRMRLKNETIRMERDLNILKQKVIKLKKEWKKMPAQKHNNELLKDLTKNIKKQLTDINNLPKIKDYIFMIYFDEMGLAEISPNNPLKVIHSQLEYEKEDEKLAFVGISNWTLDASKMNRGIYLAVPEHDENDCIETSIEIANSYMNNLGIDYKNLFILLAKSYYTYIIEGNKTEDYTDFHGARDFYNLIKIASRILLKKINEGNELIEEMEIVRKTIHRNFGGYKNSIKNFEIIVNKINNNFTLSDKIDVTNCIKENILDNESRYLMIISDTSKSYYLIQFLLTSLIKIIHLF